MKRAIIIHCWEAHPNYCWYPQAKKDLEALGFVVQVPAFPDSKNPKQDAWVPFLRQLIGQPDDELFLVGHSIGVPTILRYLEALPQGVKIGGAVLVAGFTDDMGYSAFSSFYEKPFDYEKIKSASQYGFTGIYSDNDPYVSMKYADEFKKLLGAKIVIKHAMKHFSGPVDDPDSCTALPDVAESIQKMSK